MSSAKRLLITGAAGFLGSHALRHFLINTDWKIVALLSFRHRGTSSRLAEVLVDDHYDRVTAVHHDLRGPIDPVTAREIGDVNYIVNYASESHVDRSIEDPVPFVRNNVDVMLNILEYARRYGSQLDAFVQISTDEVYGPAPMDYAHKEWDVHMPSNPYSASKAMQENLAYSYWRTYGLPLIITNCMNLIGEMQDPEKFVPKAIRAALTGDTVPVHGRRLGPGRQWHAGSRMYLHARNLADAILWLLDRDVATTYPDSYRPARFHIAGEREVDNLEMLRLISQVTGRHIDYQWVDDHTARPGHDLRYALDSAALHMTGWVPPVSFEESLHATVEWFTRPENRRWL